MKTTTVTIRIENRILNYIKTDDSVNRSVSKALDTLVQLQAVSTQEINCVFSPDEWKFLADSLNGLLINSLFKVSKEMLKVHNYDAELYDKTASKYKVDVENLNAKIDKLSGANIEAIYRRVEAFWSSPNTDLDEWSQF